MEVIYEGCAGLDVHKKVVVACRIYTKANGQNEQEKRTFGATTASKTLCCNFTHLPAGYLYNAYWTIGASDALIVAKNIPVH